MSYFWGVLQETLILNGNQTVTNETFNDLIAHCPRIKTLDLRYSKISLKGTSTIYHEGKFSVLANLEKLYLDRNEFITNEAFNALLEHCPRIKVLDLACPNISLEGTHKRIGFLTKLEELYLNYNKAVTNETFNALIARCPRIKVLNLSFTKISLEGTDTILHHWTSVLANLEKLYLEHNKYIIDKTFNALLAHCPRIKVLDIRGTNLTLKGTRLPKTLSEFDIDYDPRSKKNLAQSLRDVTNIDNLKRIYLDESVKTEIKRLQQKDHADIRTITIQT